MDSLNTISLVGILERDLSTRFEREGIQVTTFTLRLEEHGKDGKAGQVFRVYVPVQAYGKTAEAAADLNVGDIVGVEGKLVWRSDWPGQTKGTLAVFARQVTCLLTAPVAVA